MPWMLTEALAIRNAAVEAAGGETTGVRPDAGSARIVMDEPLLVKLRTVTCSA